MIKMCLFKFPPHIAKLQVPFSSKTDVITAMYSKHIVCVFYFRFLYYIYVLTFANATEFCNV